MRIANPAESEVRTDDHPTGALGIRYLLRGKENTPENFVLLVADNIKHFDMVRHRHNFDQFRFTLSGDMNLGQGLIQAEGELGYFPEGTPYGPQDDGPGRTAMVLQFGGASGYGYMSPEQYRNGREALRKTGRFDGPVYIRAREDGGTTKKFSINAIWEQIIGARMLLPAPRYGQPILMRPDAFRWLPVKGAPGAYRKHLGSFTERGVAAAMLMLKPEASLVLAPSEAIRLFFTLKGTARIDATAFGEHYAALLDPGESATLAASAESTLLEFTLPPVGADWLGAEFPAIEPVLGESVGELH